MDQSRRTNPPGEQNAAVKRLAPRGLAPGESHQSSGMISLSDGSLRGQRTELSFLPDALANGENDGRTKARVTRIRVLGVLPSAEHRGHLRPVRTTRYRIVAALIIALVTPAAARAEMQCDGRLVETGATIEQVLDWCGEPTSRVRSERTITTGLEDSIASDSVTIPVEEWTYRQEGQFTRKLVFESGRLVKVLNEGYSDLPPMF